jgi:AcrR family transcriptional regulator
MEATSMRLITQQAGVNLAAVNYHFRSKEALFEAVFLRRLGPWASDCLRQLDALEARVGSGSEALTVEAVVTAYVGPALSLSKDPSRGGPMFARALPGLSEAELEWRMHLGFSVVFHAFAGNDVLKVFGRSAVSARDPDLIVRHIVPFIVAGLTSSPTGKSPDPEGVRELASGAVL